MKHAHTVYKIALGVLLLVACPLIHAQAPAAQSEARIAHLEAENAKLRQQVRQPAVYAEEGEEQGAVGCRADLGVDARLH